MFEYADDLASNTLIVSATDRTTESETQGGTSPIPAKCGSYDRRARSA